MPYPEKERRRAKRQEWIVDLYFEGVEGVGIAQGRNVSPYGLYFNTLIAIPKGTKLKLRLPVDPEAEEYLVIEAVVTYSQPQVGVGVEFTGLDAASQQRLERFIEENCKRQAATAE